MTRIKSDAGEVHALDIGCGTGLLAAMAARAGASSVVACDLHESLCAVARKVGTHNFAFSPVSLIYCRHPAALDLLSTVAKSLCWLLLHVCMQ